MWRSVVGREVRGVRKGRNAYTVRVLYCLLLKVKKVGTFKTSQLLFTLRYSLTSQMICSVTSIPLRAANLALLEYSLSVKYSITSHTFMNFDMLPFFGGGDVIEIWVPFIGIMIFTPFRIFWLCAWFLTRVKFLSILNFSRYIQGVPGGMCQTSGECS
jgi:hypothetical protein